MASEADALESEIALIDLFGRKDKGTGCLRNFTDGGDGVAGLRHTEDAKRRMSVGHKGRPSWNKGLSPSAEYSAAMSEGQRRRIDSRNRGQHWQLSTETRKKMSESRKGHTTSEETKKKISEAHLGRKATDETRAKLSESHKGHKTSNEARRKLSESIKRSWILRRRQGKTNSAGHKNSEEAKQKMRTAALAREEKKREQRCQTSIS